MYRPRYDIMAELYKCGSFVSARYSYSLVLDFPFPGYDLVQRTSLKDSNDFDQLIVRRSQLRR